LRWADLARTYLHYAERVLDGRAAAAESFTDGDHPGRLPGPDGTARTSAPDQIPITESRLHVGKDDGTP